MESKSPAASSLVLSASRGLWAEVCCHLRSVHIECKPDGIHLYCYFDGKISEDDIESMGVAGTSVASDFPNYMVSEHCIRIDAPERIPSAEGRHIVFMRKEKDEN